MFRSLIDSPELIAIEVDDAEVRVPAGVSVAAALLYLDRLPTRSSPVSGAPRAPFCMMGVCFECLVEVDGLPAQRACQRQVVTGMKIRRSIAAGHEGST